MTIKLNKANVMIFTLRHLVDEKSLKSIFYAIFESHF